MLPSSIIAKSIGAPEGSNIKEVISYLCKVNKFVMFIADELHSVFCLESSIGQPIMRDNRDLGF